MEPFELKVTTPGSKRLETARHRFSSVPEVMAYIRSHIQEPTIRFAVDCPDDSGIELMKHLSYVQLTVSPKAEHTCALCSRAPAQSESSSIELGWQSFPAFMVIQDIEKALAAAELFLVEKQLAPSSIWECEEP